jgi:hypothetical protein
MMNFRPNVAVSASDIFSAYARLLHGTILNEAKGLGDKGTARCLIKRSWNYAA